MSISYPLTPPSTGIAAIELTPVTVAGMTEGEFDLTEQVFEWTGQRWEGVVELRQGLPDSVGRLWEAFAGAMAGLRGTALFGPLRPQRGTASGVTVNGAGQTGKTLTVGGTGTVLAGCYLQVGSGSTSRLHINMGVDLTLDASEVIDIFPRLRESPGNGSTVIFASPKGVFRLAEPMSWRIDNKGLYYFRPFRIMEALRG